MRTHPLRIVLGEPRVGPAARRLRAPAALAARPSHALAEPHDVDAGRASTASPSGNPFFVTEVLAGGAGRDPRDRPRRRSCPRRAALSPSALERARGASRSMPAGGRALAPARRSPRATRRAARRVPRLRNARRARTASSPSDTSSPGSRSRSRSTPDRRRALHRRTLPRSRRGRPASTDAARLAHHAERPATPRPSSCSRRPRRDGRRRSALTAKPRRSTRRALRYADGLTAGDRAELLERYSQRVLPDRRAGRGDGALYGSRRTLSRAR